MKETKENILLAAKKIFGKYGLKKTAVDDIAKEARIGKATIYHYYQSKEDIFTATVEAEVEAFKSQLAATVDTITSPEKKLKAYVTNRMVLIAKFANFYSTFKHEYIEYYSFVEKIHAKYSEYEKHRIAQIIREGVEKGVFSVKDPDLTAFALTIAMKGIEYYWALEPEKEIENKTEILMDFLYKGMLKR
jgi:AcrR family transcriptional regulator